MDSRYPFRYFFCSIFFFVIVLSGYSAEPRNSGKRIGSQISSARSLLSLDLESGLIYISERGYTTIETYGYNNGLIMGHPVDEFAALVLKYGLTITSSHASVRYDPFTEDFGGTHDKRDRLIDDQLAMGCKYIVIANFRYVYD